MAVQKKKQKVTVKYDAWQGIVEERIIRENEWAAIGIEFKTVSFNKSNNFRHDATDWPEDVMEYFEERDQAFKVLRAEEAVEAPKPSEPENAPQETGSLVTDEENAGKAEEKPSQTPPKDGKTR
jgi:hypothetical protein